MLKSAKNWKKPYSLQFYETNIPLEEDFQLATHQDIDKKFQQYCEMYSDKYELVLEQQQIQDKKSPPLKQSKNQNNSKSFYQQPLSSTHLSKISMLNNTKNTFYKDSQKVSLSQNQGLYTLNDKITNQSFTTLEKANDVLQKINNILADDVHIKQSGMPFNSKLIKEFDINMQHCSNLKTQEEKQIYIMQCIRNTLSEDYQSFLEKLELRERQYKEQQRITDLHQKLAKEKSDNFQWLNLKSNYNSLKKKLRASLVEVINDFENQEKIAEGLKQIRKNKSARDRSLKITLDITSKLSNSNQQQDLAITYPQQIKNRPQTSRSQRVSISNMNIENKQLENYMDKNEKLQENNSNMNINNKQNQNGSIDSKENYNWSTLKEKNFKEHREQAKTRMSQLVKSSSWNEVGFAPLIQASNQEEKNKLERQTKLQKYMQGEQLSNEEMRYLANTSILLNSCVDKKFYQAAANILDDEVKEDIELNLAEEIISNYAQHYSTIKQSRLQYLEELNHQAQQLSKNNQKRYNKLRQMSQNQFEQKRIKKRIENHLKNIEKNKEIAPSILQQQIQQKTKKMMTEDKINEDNNNNAFLMQAIAKSFAKAGQQHPNKFNQDALQDMLKRLVPNYTKGRDIKLQKFRLHPASKIFLKETDPNSRTRSAYISPRNHNQSNTTLNNNQQTQGNSHILHIHTPVIYRVPDNFRKFYSGGPQKQEDDLNQRWWESQKQNGQFQLTQKEKKAGRKILALLRGLKQRKAYIRLREEIKFRKYMQQQQLNQQQIENQQNQKVDQQKIIKDTSQNLKNSKVLSQILTQNKKNTLQTTFDSVQLKELNMKTLNSESQFSPLKTSQSKTSQKFDFLQALKGVDQIQNFPKKINQKEKGIKITQKKLLNNRPKTTQNQIKSQQTSIFGIIQENDNSAIKNKILPNQVLLLKQKKLLQAAKQNKLHLILSSGLVFSKNDMDARDEDGNSALYYSAKYGNEKFVKYLIDLGADPNLRCQHANTPMHAVFQSNDELLIIYLLSKGGSLNILNDQGQSPVAFGSAQILKKLDLSNAIASVNNLDKKQVSNDDRINNRQTKPEQYENGILNFGFKKLQQPSTQVSVQYQESSEHNEKSAVQTYLPSKNNKERSEDQMPNKFQKNYVMSEIEFDAQNDKIIAKVTLEPNNLDKTSPKISQKGNLNNIELDDFEKFKNKLLEIQLQSSNS